MQNYGRIVQVAKVVNTKGIDSAMRDEKCDVYADSFTGRRSISGDNCSSCRDKIS